MSARSRLLSSSTTLLAALLLTGCGGSGEGEAEQLAADSAQMGGMAMDTTGGAQSQAPDVQFLTQMSDHHQGLIVMAQGAHQKTDVGVHEEATELQQKQEQEQQQMLSMLQSTFQTQHTPTIMPQNQAMADSVQQKNGAEYDRAFREAVIRHHQEGIQMIDQHLGHLTNAEVRQMAERMRTEQQQDIEELQAKLQSR